MALKFTALGKGKTPAAPSTSDQTAASTPPEVAREPVTEPGMTGIENAVTVPTPVSTALSMFQAEDATASLAAMTEDDGRGSRLAYPIIDISGGNTGGAFQPMKKTPVEVADLMPQGRKPFPLFFLGYRTEVFAWPAAKSDTADENTKAPKPVWRCSIPCTNGADTRLVRQAVENYTFKPKGDKAAYDAEATGIGHLKVQFAALIYQPDMGMLAVVQGTPHFKAWVRSGESAAKLIDPTTKRWTGEPVLARVVTSDEKGAVPWKMHSLVFELMAAADRGKYTEAAKQFAAAMAENVEEQTKALDWLTVKSGAITDDIRAKLTHSLSL